MFTNIFFGLCLIAMWAVILKYRKIVRWWTGNFYWAEKHLWRGWTYFIIMLIGLFLIFLWVIYPFWWLDLLIKWWGDSTSSQFEENVEAE